MKDNIFAVLIEFKKSWPNAKRFKAVSEKMAEVKASKVVKIILYDGEVDWGDYVRNVTSLKKYTHVAVYYEKN